MSQTYNTQKEAPQWNWCHLSVMFLIQVKPWSLCFSTSSMTLTLAMRSLHLIGFPTSVSSLFARTRTFLVMTVILGTVASAKAYSSLAPCRMMPPYSWAVPVENHDSNALEVSVNSQIGLLLTCKVLLFLDCVYMSHSEFPGLGFLAPIIIQNL